MNNATAAPRGRELDRIMEMLDASARLCAEVEAMGDRVAALRQDRSRGRMAGARRRRAVTEARP